MEYKDKKIYKLADLFLAAMPDSHILRWSPENYGNVVTDDHRTFCWNELVDNYLLFPDADIEDLYYRYVTLGEPMEEDVLAQLAMEEMLLAAIADTIESRGVVIQLRRATEADKKEAAETVTDDRLQRLVRPEHLN